MPPTIRPMETRDADAVRDLMRQLCDYEMTRAEMLDRLNYVNSSAFDWLFVCEVGTVEEKSIVGVLTFRLRERIERPGRDGEIYALVVDERARRQGIGRVLMDYAENLARQHECAGIWLVSDYKRADEAYKFYAGLGYESAGRWFVKPLGA